MTRLVVQERSFWQTRLGIALAALLLALLLWGSFELGRYRAGYDVLSAADTRTMLAEQISTLEKQTKQLREQKAVLERSSQIERQAYKQLEGAVTGLQDEILELKEELAFYRGIVSPKDASKGLKIQKFELTSGSQARSYHYKVVLTQVLNNSTVARGNMQLEIEGLLNGEEKRYALHQISADAKKTGQAFRFKYFQILEGDMLLPEGFEAIKINLTVKPSTKAHKRLTQAYDWVVGENS